MGAPARWVAFGALACVVDTTIAVGGRTFGAVRWERGELLVLEGAALLLLGFGFAGTSRGAWVGAALLGLFVALPAWVAYDGTVGHETCGCMGCPAFTWAELAGMSALIWTLPAGAAALALGEKVANGAILGRAAAWAWTISLVALLVGAWRLAGHPEPEAYVASLPIVARPLPSEGAAADLGPFHLRYHCPGMFSACEGRWRVRDSSDPGGWTVRLPAGRFEVRHDPVEDMWLVVGNGRPQILRVEPRPMPTEETGRYPWQDHRAAFHASLADHLAPPRAWLAGALLGVVLAGQGLLMGRSEPGRADEAHAFALAAISLLASPLLVAIVRSCLA